MNRKLAWAILIVGLVIRVVLALTRPEVLWIDDSFYSLGIARNIALGKGWTHDGVHITNGFQPLYVFLMVPFYAVLPAYDRLVPMLSLVMESLLNVGTGWILYRLISSRIGARGALLSLIVWSVSPYIISGVNGLETPIHVFLLVLVASLYLSSWRSILVGAGTSLRKQAWVAAGLGFLLGLAILTRIDSLVFAAALLVDLAARAFWRLCRERRQWVDFLWVIGIVGFTLALIQIPWFVASLARTGRLAFDSGVANRLKSIVDYKGNDIFFDHFLSLIPYLRMRTVTSFLPWSAMVPLEYFFVSLPAMVGVYVIAYKTGAVRRRASAILADFSFLWLGGIGLILAYTCYQFSVWHWPRYFYPLSVAGLVLLGVWIEAICDSLQSVSLGSLSWDSVVYTLVCLGFVVILPFSLPLAVNPLLADPEDWFTRTQYDAAAWLSRNTPPDTRIGAYQSGILGYFSGRQVINLDGVVNHAALPYNLDRDTAFYLVIEDIDYFVDWPILIEQVDFDEANLNAKVVTTFNGVNDVEIIALSHRD